ncbi:hypothetical protein [Mucilaginibacter sp. OK098]|uniref:hypothetical protein n=1 Tax=Mucilaginibacter sp. OK098 TaxID=1855297 RepID=UPI00091328C6|nr:hypothetical protein [Mucilaginibacter sp. OK098]SHN36729.1 hypothetical protein SAMN05216524_1144 [Mucilaginibacter sp. OK098]
MQTFIIKVPDHKLQIVDAFLKESGLAFRSQTHVANADTKAAMDELKSGKGRQFKSVDELFKSI